MPSKEIGLSTEPGVNKLERIQRSPDRTAPKTYREGNQCVAHKKTGERCQKAPIMGATVCRFHGGASGHVKRAAKARLENAADRMARQLLGIADDPDAPPAVKLAAIKDALDRAGLSPAQALAVTHELKPYEQILTHIVRGPRRGSTPPSDDPDIVDAEVVGAACRRCGLDFSEWPEPEGGYPALCKACRVKSTAAPTEPTRRAATAAGTGDPGPGPSAPSAGRTGPARAPRPPSDGGLLTGEEAVRHAADGQPRARRKRRLGA